MASVYDLSRKLLSRFFLTALRGTRITKEALFIFHVSWLNNSLSLRVDQSVIYFNFAHPCVFVTEAGTNPTVFILGGLGCIQRNHPYSFREFLSIKRRGE